MEAVGKWHTIRCLTLGRDHARDGGPDADGVLMRKRASEWFGAVFRQTEREGER